MTPQTSRRTFAAGHVPSRNSRDEEQRRRAAEIEAAYRELKIQREEEDA
jgi:hypothetical protein